MLKYRLLLGSMLLAAFLNSLQAQEHDSMPAELEVSLDRVTKQGIGYHISGNIPLELPGGDDNFVVKAKMRAYWRFSTVYRKCKLGAAFIPLQVFGGRNQDQLTLAINLPPEIPRPACGDGSLVEAASKVSVDIGNLNSTDFTLFVADGSNAERTVEDSSHLDKLTGKLALHLACSVTSIDSEAPAISVLPTDTIQWPLRFDDSKTSAEIGALAKTPTGVVGLTRPGKPYPPLATFRAASRHAALRPGFCFWVKSLQVEFTPVEILLASKIPSWKLRIQCHTGTRAAALSGPADSFHTLRESGDGSSARSRPPHDRETRFCGVHLGRFNSSQNTNRSDASAHLCFNGKSSSGGRRCAGFARGKGAKLAPVLKLGRALHRG